MVRGGIMYTLNNVEVHCVCYRKTGHPREQGGIKDGRKPL